MCSLPSKIIGAVALALSVGSQAGTADLLPLPPGPEHLSLRASPVVKPGNKVGMNKLDVFIPLRDLDNTVYYLDFRGVVPTGDGYESNIGAGYRRILDDGWIVGGFGFYDHIESSRQNHFNRLMAGFEALSELWEVRANAYVSLTRPKTMPVAGGALYDEFCDTCNGIWYEHRRNEILLSGLEVEVGRPLGNKGIMGYLGGYYFDESNAQNSGGHRLRLDWRFGHLLTPAPWAKQLHYGFMIQSDNAAGISYFSSLRYDFKVGKNRHKALTPLQELLQGYVVRDGGEVEPTKVMDKYTNAGPCNL